MNNRDLSPSFSQVILSDLVTYHGRLAAGGDHEFDPRLAFARCIEALADVRLGTLLILEEAIALHEANQPEMSLAILKTAAEKYRDKCPEGVRQ